MYFTVGWFRVWGYTVCSPIAKEWPNPACAGCHG
jgi:hypothetical protein